MLCFICCGYVLVTTIPPPHCAGFVDKIDNYTPNGAISFDCGSMPILHYAYKLNVHAGVSE